MLPDLGALCIKTEVTEGVCFTFPGGAEMCIPFPGSKIPDPSELTAAILGGANAALAPMVPIFNVIDLLVAMVDCIKAVEEALGPPPDPSKLIKCFPEMIKRLQKILRMLPPLSIPVMVGELLDIIILYFTGVRKNLLAVIKKQLRLLAASERAHALGSVALHTIVDCATADLDSFLVNMNQNAKPIGRFVVLLNTFLQMAGLPPIPDITDIATNAREAIEPLDNTITMLKRLRRTLP